MLTPPQVLPLLAHEDVLVRELAAQYLSKCHDPAPATAGDALRAFDRFAEGPLSYLRGLIAALPATPEDVAEMLRRLEGGVNEDLADTLHRALSDLSIPTAQAMEAAIKQAAYVPEEVREHVWFRVRQAEHTPEDLWAKLLDMAAKDQAAYEGGYKAPFTKLSSDSVILALARHPGFAAPRVLEILSDASIQDAREEYAVQLAGALRLETAVPILVEKLKIDADLLRERVNDALTAIGTVEVVRRLREMIPGEEWHVRLFADDPLERIKCPEAEEALLELLALEESEDLRTNLAYSLSLQVSERGFPFIEQMVLDDSYDGQMAALDESLCALAIIFGRTFPKADPLRARIDQRRADQARRMTDPAFMMSRMAGLMSETDSADDPLLDATANNRLEVMPPTLPPQQPMRNPHAKVGRNDPCPCGSGKKYKKCCGP